MESEIQASEFRIPHITIEIQNPSSTDLQRLESRIQDCLEFPYMGRFGCLRRRKLAVGPFQSNNLTPFWSSLRYVILIIVNYIIIITNTFFFKLHLTSRKDILSWSSQSVEAIDVNITPHMSNTTFLGYGL